jgi:hypothetical protein
MVQYTEKFHMTLTGMKKHVVVLEQAGLVTTRTLSLEGSARCQRRDGEWDARNVRATGRTSPHPGRERGTVMKSSVVRTSVARLLVKTEAYALRVTAKGHSAKPRLLRSRRIRFTSGLAHECYRLLQVGNLEENINLRRILAVKANSHRGSLKPAAALRHWSEGPSEDPLEERAGALCIRRAELDEGNVAVHKSSRWWYADHLRNYGMRLEEN